MKRKWLSLLCTLVMIAGLVSVSAVETKASAELPMIDGSYLTHDSESVGYNTKGARGQWLLTGYSKCVRKGAGKLYAGGSTVATQKVEEVGISVIVERAQEGDDHWTSCTAWSKFNKNADRVSSGEMLEVEGGYYYRVRCIHSAGGEGSDSFTNGVYIE